ncbi:sensor histidine kinase [Spirillospora sp. CA-294931]|uniref:sensor histidine kinase n=1 Tax=Spirillospora sp. CA-294931 TaxID=3240042 RepID=UPI003D8B8487
MRIGNRCVGLQPLRLAVITGLIGWAYVKGLLGAEPRPSPSGAGLAVLLLNLSTLALLVGSVQALRKSRERLGVGLVLGSIVLALGLYGAWPENTVGMISSMVGLWIAAARLPIVWAVLVGSAAVTTVAAVGEFARGGDIEYAVMAAFAGIVLGASADRERRVAQEATQQAEAANVVLGERSHMAREIHDILAHSLSAQIVHLEGARLLLSRDGDRVQALDRVERAQRLAKAGLEETRRALATLRGEAPPPDAALAELAEEFHAVTGRACEVDVTGVPRDLPPQAGLAVVRTAQEALTNVRKHAPGARVRVSLVYAADRIELDVTDSGGTEQGEGPEGGGYGLVGMRERAELIGGTLETGPNGKGFQVSLRVPV